MYGVMLHGVHSTAIDIDRWEHAAIVGGTYDLILTKSSLNKVANVLETTVAILEDNYPHCSASTARHGAPFRDLQSVMMIPKSAPSIVARNWGSISGGTWSQ